MFKFLITLFQLSCCRWSLVKISGLSLTTLISEFWPILFFATIATQTCIGLPNTSRSTEFHQTIWMIQSQLCQTLWTLRMLTIFWVKLSLNSRERITLSLLPESSLNTSLYFSPFEMLFLLIFHTGNLYILTLLSELFQTISILAPSHRGFSVWTPPPLWKFHFWFTLFCKNFGHPPPS